jgi:hypothetical protein
MHLTRLVVGEEHARIFHSILEAAAQSEKVDVTAMTSTAWSKSRSQLLMTDFAIYTTPLTSGELEPSEADSGSLD